MSQRSLILLCAGVLLLCAAVIAGVCFGSTSIALSVLCDVLQGKGDALASMVIIDHRLPRVVMAASAGAVLAIAGQVFQNVLRNPLAEPYILGISGGAAVGAVLGVLLGLASLLSTMAAFGGSLLVLFLILALWDKMRDTQSLLLGGVMVNAFCGAIVLFLISLARPGQVGSIMFWFMGNLGVPSLQEALYYVLFFMPGLLLLMCSGHRMNLLLLGRDKAQSLGLPVESTVLGLLLVTSLMVSSLTALVGPLGFVGLVVPQVTRLIAGGDNRILAPASVLLGAAFLVLCDTLARALPEQGEIPVGVLTALLGAPVFILLVWRKR